MSNLIEKLSGATRALWNVPLVPLQGTRFQPTGFPDLGPATYSAGATDCLLVESAQSMANRLEATAWDSARNELDPVMTGLSYVRVLDKSGAFLTSSVLEAHRLNSAYIEKAEAGFGKQVAETLGADKKRPIDRKRFVEGVLKLDVGSLVHGVFLESIDGRLRLPRALSSFIEATGVGVAPSGGVKNDRVRAEKEKDKDKADGEKAADAAEGFGNVPFHREEYTADAITAYFSVDLAQIRSYPLPVAATELLTLLALWKIRRLLDGDLRLRTACDLMVKPGYDFTTVRPLGYVLPEARALDGAVREHIAACRGFFGGEGGVTTVTYAK